MKYHHQLASELSEEQYHCWCDILKGRADLDHPFFHPELTRRTAAVRDDIEVTVLSESGEPVGFFPFRRGSGGIAQSIPGRLSEFHGVISRPDTSWSPRELIRSSKLRAWYFDHLPSTQREFEEFAWRYVPSPFIDLSQGYENYRSQIKKSGSSLSQIERKQRKLEREIGSLEFSYHTSKEEVFQLLLEWKTAQHRRTGVLEVLKTDWVVSLLRSLLHEPTPGFAGVFSVLEVGKQPVAVHLGLRTATNLHMWFPAYDVAFEKYSPGLILILELAKSAAQQGIARIEFGKGPERYKQNLKSGDTQIAEGAVDLRHVQGSLRRCWHQTKQWMRSSRYHKQLEIPLNATRKLRQWAAFH